jgi:hypothetical protein
MSERPDCRRKVAKITLTAENAASALHLDAKPETIRRLNRGPRKACLFDQPWNRQSK